MKIKYIDAIYRSHKKPTCAEIELIKPLPTKTIFPPKKKSLKWLLFWGFVGGAFLVLFLAFWILFQAGFLGKKTAIIRILYGLRGNYLVLFQNNTELRPTGGFIGSFADVEVDRGLIKQYYFETNIYKRDKKYVKENCVKLPPPFQEIWPGACEALRDANWSPDFKEAAQDIEWFYKEEGGNGVDGVIAIDTNFFVDLLRLIGPIEMPEYNLTLNADNFVKETQYQVEVAYFENPENRIINEPKTILKEMMPKVIERLRHPKMILPLLKILEKNLDEKHILMALKDSRLSQIAAKNNWDGAVKSTNKDYLYINNANIAGLKSSASVFQTVNLTVSIKKDGFILNRLSITRTHKGGYDWPNGINRNYTRVLVPKGSQLIESRGIEKINQTEELGKSVFGFWSTVAPGETKTFEITYLLPFLKSESYSLLIQKQPGAPSDYLNFTLEGASKWKWEGEINKDKIIQLDLTTH